MRRSIASFVALGLFVSVSSARAQDVSQASCDELLPPLRELKTGKVGPKSCMLQQSDLAIGSRAYRRLDIGLSGTVEGTIAKAGSYREYLTNAPDLVFPQAGNPGPLYFGVAGYEREKGAALTLVLPADASAWNGKLWVTAHGRGRAFKTGQLKPWDEYFE